MSDTLDRLRRLHGLREQKPSEQKKSDPRANESPTDRDAHLPNTTAPDERTMSSALPARPPSNIRRLEDVVPGTSIETEAGACYVSTHAYPLTVPRGDFPLQTLLNSQPQKLEELYPSGIRDPHFDYSRAVFIDTETSGLGGGSYCFMVGVGAFETLPARTLREHSTRANSISEPDLESEPLVVANADLQPDIASSQSATHFVVRQFFMRHPGEETALLAALGKMLAAYELTVTFNGRAFDLPMLRSRYRLHRHFLPNALASPAVLNDQRPHLDLLPLSRRLWRSRLQSCRLINLEQKILHLYRHEEDVPGHLIPMLYIDYTRNGNAQVMRGVFYHNREDIVSMVGIAAHLTASLEASTDTDKQHTTAQPLHGLEWLSLGRHYAKQGRLDEARTALRQATQSILNPSDRALALSELATLHKRLGEWEAACETWQLWITSIPGNDPTPYIELAKYCEWQVRDHAQAEMWTAWALHNLQGADPRSIHRGRIAELQHRLQRIQTKRNTSARPSA